MELDSMESWLLLYSAELNVGGTGLLCLYGALLISLVSLEYG